MRKIKAIVDTNVILVADGRTPQASDKCVEECINRLWDLKEKGKIILDDDWYILSEYYKKLSRYQGEPGFGYEFYKWVTNYNFQHKPRQKYKITPLGDYGDFVEFPRDPSLTNFDLNDRKFAALAFVSQTPVWNAVDSDWWNYRTILRNNGIKVEFLCPNAFTNS